MEKQLLILGLLLSHGMHGYQLNEMLKHNPGTPISLKKSNAYKLLADMEKDGWVEHTQEQHGKRPQRRVYSLTKEGEDTFYRLLRENLSSYPTPEFPSAIGFDFINLLPPQEAVELLEQRLRHVTERFNQLENLSIDIRESHPTSEYLHNYYASEIKWLDKLINHLQET